MTMSVTSHRRDWITAGALSFFGGGALTHWAQGVEHGDRHRNFGTAKSCVVVFLFGGQGQQDTYDLKPNAPAEIRGEFSPIATNVVGTQICEHLPHLSKTMDKGTLIPYLEQILRLGERTFQHTEPPSLISNLPIVLYPAPPFWGQ